MELIQQTEQLLNGLSGKMQVKSISEAFTTQIEEGYTNPLEFAVKAKMLIKALEEAIDKTQEQSMYEQSKYGKTAQVFGAEVQQFEAGIKYDFSGCNDLEYEKLLQSVELSKSALKERETFLKSLTKTENVIDENGEIRSINPPIKTSKTTLKITIK